MRLARAAIARSVVGVIYSCNIISILACGPEAPSGQISLTDATLAADGLARHAHAPAQYKRACYTRLRDGFLLTYRFAPLNSRHNEGILGAPSFVRIVVPDSGPAMERQSSAAADQPFVREQGALPPRDSSSTVASARRALAEQPPLHCVLPLIGGAWVEFVSSDSASVRSVQGTVVAVNGNGGARVIARY
ncbi:MAG TPA: hypothetical protein VHV78_18160 [Gemmatimonadaceae bacterium]|jgi:hypothetical protein|nr:hypothetical protein [Gemmatimonadaceae bacterium]